MSEKLLTPQQELFLASYTNPKSPTFGNALQSALNANYSQEYAESITYQLPEWLSENLGDLQRLQKAEKVLDKTLEMDVIGEDGKVDTQLHRTQSDVAKFIASSLGKSKYSTRTEQTGPNGEPLSISVVNFKDNAQTN